MLTAININATKPYVSKRDPDKDNPTVFQIGIMDPFLRAHIEDKSTSFEISSTNPDEAARANAAMKKKNIMLVKFGIRGIENFIDPVTKAPIKISLDNHSIGGKGYPAIPDKILVLLGSVIIDELADAVVKEQDLSGEEAKN
jgi:hypothetical protein